MLIPAATCAQVTPSDDTVKLVDPGTTPDNFWYYLDVAMDNLALAVTFNIDDKVNKSLEIAEERLAEARAMAEKGDFDAMKKAEVEHENAMTQLKGEVNSLQDNDPENSLKEKLKIMVKVSQYDDKLDEIDVSIKGNITEEQKAYFIAMLRHFKNQTRDVELDIEDALNYTRDKLGGQADEIEAKIREMQGIGNFERVSAENMRSRAELKWAEVIVKATQYNVTIPDRSDFDALLANGDTLLANGSYEAAKDAYEVAKDYAEDAKKGVDTKEKEENGFNLSDSNKMRFEAEMKWAEVMEKAIESHVAVPDRAAFDKLLAKGDTLTFQGSFKEAKDSYEQAKNYAEKVKGELEKDNSGQGK